MADTYRLFVIFLGLILAMVCVKVAVTRLRDPSQWGEGGPWALMSYGLFVFLPVINGLRRFGQPLDPWGTPIYMAAVICGMIAARHIFRQAWRDLVNRWRGREEPPPT